MARTRVDFGVLLGLGLIALGVGCGRSTEGPREEVETVTAAVQHEPGGPVEDGPMKIHRVPVDPPAVSAEKADLQDDELVLGVVLDSGPVAYPVRYLALSEVVNDAGLAPTW